MSTIQKALGEQVDAFTTHALKQANRQVGMSDEDLRQIFRGFAAVIVAARKGDEKPRELYIDGVVKGIKEHGMSLGVIMTGMVQTAFILGSWLEKCGASSEQPWLSAWLGRYADALVEVYRR